MCRVSPAHAGIDPRYWRSMSRWQRSPPRTRGSTFRIGGGVTAAVSPAHAGIDPGCDASSDQAMRSPPRTRGSTLVVGAGSRGPWSPPRTRGSTLRRHADRLAWRRLPRARGDRPAAVGIGGRTRRVSPAHAGIDLWMPVRTSRRDRSPPRTRGSTRLGASCRFVQAGLPRARGDRPWPYRRIGAGGVSPAHAGIDPRCSRLVPPARASPPRTRGSTLAVVHDVSSDATSPPRTRGSTLPCWSRDAAGGSPPRTRGSTCGSRRQDSLRMRLPRARGDRPIGALTAARCASLPRARGDRPRSPIASASSSVRLPRARGDRPCARDAATETR